MSRHLERGHDEKYPWVRVLIIAGLCLYVGALLGVYVGSRMTEGGWF